MKLLVLVGLGVFLLFAIIGIVSFYSASDNQLPIEMVAFNSLNDQEAALIPVSPKDSSVERISVDEEFIASLDQNDELDEAYSVTFHHTATNSTGNLVVYVGLDQKTVIGKGFTEE